MIVLDRKVPPAGRPASDLIASRTQVRDSPLARLCELDPEHLSLSELFTVLIDPRERDESAAASAEQVLRQLRRGDGDGPLRIVARTSPAQLAQRAAVPLETAARLVAAVEIGRRAMEERLPARPRLNTGSEIFEFMRWRIRDRSQEECHLILLNGRHEARLRLRLTVGTADTCLITPREVYRAAVVGGASAIILVHNHPSGDPSPSEHDRSVTRALARAGDTISIEFIDHVIVGDARYFSFREAGELAA